MIRSQISFCGVFQNFVTLDRYRRQLIGEVCRIDLPNGMHSIAYKPNLERTINRPDVTNQHLVFVYQGNLAALFRLSLAGPYHLPERIQFNIMRYRCQDKTIEQVQGKSVGILTDLGHVFDGLRDVLESLDAVIIEPPETSEQVIDPPAFFSGEGALPIEVPVADGEVEVTQVGGAALIDALFQGNLIRQNVSWGGDQMVIWAEGDLSCVRWDIRADDEVGAAGLQSGFDRWIDVVGNGTVTVVDSTTIRIDRCS